MLVLMCDSLRSMAHCSLHAHPGRQCPASVARTQLLKPSQVLPASDGCVGCIARGLRGDCSLLRLEVDFERKTSLLIS